MAEGLKDREVQEYYESMGAMFATPGWKYFAKDMTKLLDAADKLNGIRNEAELQFRLGQVDILKKVLVQPDVIEAAHDFMLLEEK